MIKVILIEPPDDQEAVLTQFLNSKYYYPALWTLALATYIKEKIPKTNFKIIDGRFEKFRSLNGIEKEIKDFKPDFVGLSPKFLSYSNTLKIARISKKLGAKVILGGCHATHLRKEILENRGPGSDDYCVDAVVQYDGEKALYEYIIGKDPSKINNLVYREKGKVRENPIELLDLDLLPIPDRDLLNLEKDYFKKRRAIIVFSQRGCHWRERSGGCLFCIRTHFGLRIRNPKKFWQELDFLNKKYRPEVILDGSEDFLNDFNWLKEFHHISFNYSKKPKLKVSLRTSEVSEETLRIFKDLNIVEVAMGVESGSPQSLQALRKGLILEQNETALRLLKKYNIRAWCDFVLGAPGESKKTIGETVNFIKKSPLKEMGYERVRIHTLVPWPGSFAWQMLKEKTGDKYQGKDLIDWMEIKDEWIKGFCKISVWDFNKALKKITNDFKIPED